MKIKYLCGSWQGLVQQVVYLVGRGYYFHCVTELPEKKRDKWEQIDQKLIGKYSADKSKWQRARQKGKKTANFYYLRWNNLSVLLHTLGSIESGSSYDDNFKDIRDKKGRLKIQISKLIGLEIFLGDCKKGGSRQVTVKLDKDTYTGFKAIFDDVAATKNVKYMVKEFDKLNGFPAWGGIIKQKRELARFIVNRARHHQADLKQEQLRINGYRKPVKVFLE